VTVVLSLLGILLGVPLGLALALALGTGSRTDASDCGL
jgi:hypothetical protein